jgi:hypothetical protein
MKSDSLIAPKHAYLTTEGLTTPKMLLSIQEAIPLSSAGTPDPEGCAANGGENTLSDGAMLE